MKKKKILLIIGAITLITVITLAIILLNNNKDNKNKEDLSDNVNNTNIIDNEELEDIEEVEEETEEEEEESNEHKLRITPIDDSNNESKTNKQTITTSNKNSNINNNVDSSDYNNIPQNTSNNSKTNNDKNDIEITVKPTKTVDSTITVDTPTTVKPSTTKQEYKCPSGYTLDGNMCYKEVRPRIEYLCGINQEEAGGYCLIDTSTYADVSYSCPDGYNLSGDTCYKEQITGSYNPKQYENMAESLQISYYNSFQNSCRGTIRNENGLSYCYETVQTYANATYSCPSGAGELAGNKCISIKTEKAFEKYHCDEGSLDPISKMCVIRIKAEKK